MADYIENLNLRQIAVDYMKAMASVEWTATERIDYSFNNKCLIYEPGQKYLGMIYNNNKNGLENFKLALDEEGRFKLTDLGWNTCPGNSCATSIKHAWQLISPDVEYDYSINMMPFYAETHVLPIGNISWSTYDGKNTTNTVLNMTALNDLYEAYAAALPGDGFMRYLDTGGHALMVTLEPHVVRREDGTIDPEQSEVFLTDQNNIMNTRREYPSSWKVDRAMTFELARTQGWLPVTVKELVENKAAVPVFSLETDKAPGDIVLSCNYCLVTVAVTPLDAAGEVCGEPAVFHPYLREVSLAEQTAALPDACGKLLIEAEAGLGKAGFKIPFAK